MDDRIAKQVKATIEELSKRGADASLLSREIEIVIHDLWPHYEAERDWGEVAKRLRLI